MFRFATISLTFLLGAVLIGGMQPHTANARSSSSAEAYWRCPSGFAFETSGSAVHCKKPAWIETKAFMACMTPTPTLKIDLVGYTDMCAGSVGVTVTAEPLCNPVDVANGFVKRRADGKDYCAKSHAAEIMAPNQLITF